MPFSQCRQKQNKSANADEQAQTSKPPGAFHLQPHPETGDRPQHDRHDDAVNENGPHGICPVRLFVAAAAVEHFEEVRQPEPLSLDLKSARVGGVSDAVGADRPVAGNRDPVVAWFSTDAVGSFEPQVLKNLLAGLFSVGAVAECGGIGDLVNRLKLRFDTLQRSREEFPVMHAECAEGVHHDPGRQKQRQEQMRPADEKGDPHSRRFQKSIQCDRSDTQTKVYPQTRTTDAKSSTVAVNCSFVLCSRRRAGALEFDQFDRNIGPIDFEDEVMVKAPFAVV